MSEWLFFSSLSFSLLWPWVGVIRQGAKGVRVVLVLVPGARGADLARRGLSWLVNQGGGRCANAFRVLGIALVVGLSLLYTILTYCVYV